MEEIDEYRIPVSMPRIADLVADGYDEIEIRSEDGDIFVSGEPDQIQSYASELYDSITRIFRSPAGIRQERKDPQMEKEDFVPEIDEVSEPVFRNPDTSSRPPEEEEVIASSGDIAVGEYPTGSYQKWVESYPEDDSPGRENDGAHIVEGMADHADSGPF